MISGEGKAGQQGDDDDYNDKENLSPAKQRFGCLLTQELIGEAKQRRAENQAEEGDRLNAVPGIQGSGGGQNYSDRDQNEGFQHQDEEMTPAVLMLQKKIDQEGGQDTGRGAHTESQHKGQRVDIEAAEVEPALLFARGRKCQPQSKQNTNACAAGKNVGVGKDGGHADAGLHAVQVDIVRRVTPQEGQQRGAEQPGRDQINAEQAGQSGGAFQNGCHSPAGVCTFARGEKHQKKGGAKSGDQLQQLIEGELSGDGVGRGDAAHEHHQQQQKQGQVHPAQQSPEAENACQQRDAEQDENRCFDGSGGAETDGQEKQNRQNRQPDHLLGCGCFVVYAQHKCWFSSFRHNCHLAVKE